jgi:hypothetical protein
MGHAGCENFSAHLETHHSRRAVVRKLERHSVNAADLRLRRIDQFLVEDIAYDSHRQPPPKI